MSYNGWTNKETWTVVIEFIVHIESDTIVDYELFGDSVSDTANNVETFIRNWAWEFGEDDPYPEGFLEEVNWLEIAESLEYDFKEEVDRMTGVVDDAI